MELAFRFPFITFSAQLLPETFYSSMLLIVSFGSSGSFSFNLLLDSRLGRDFVPGYMLETMFFGLQLSARSSHLSYL